MRRPIIAGNWKMNMTRASSIELAREIADGVSGDATEVVICPPFVYLDAVTAALGDAAIGDAPIGLGAQDMYHEQEGAFTGEISAAMLQDVGCQFVILGHSERRNVLGETNEQVNAKTKAALAAGLTPIVCVGELLEQREAGQTRQVIESQFEGSFADLSATQIAQVVIAYEPVWAIGTGKTASPEQAQQVHADLRTMLKKHYNAHVSQQVRIQYGGSVKADNADKLLSQPDIDGALVGGASLNVDQFLAIVAAATATVG